jgi:hypothetical protein
MAVRSAAVLSREPCGGARGPVGAELSSGHHERVIMRIWRTRVDEGRAAEYERFAAEESLPMFSGQPGFLG